MSLLYALLLAVALVVLVAAEWPRLRGLLGERAVPERIRTRERRQRKSHLRLVRTESEEFAASVERDLSQIPTIEERSDRRSER